MLSNLKIRMACKARIGAIKGDSKVVNTYSLTPMPPGAPGTRNPAKKDRENALRQRTKGTVFKPKMFTNIMYVESPPTTGSNK